jgi:glutamate synthase (NADPH/NADH) small chain
VSVRSNRVTMPKQDPAVRRRNFDEVALGFTYKQATAEASRCLNCRNKPCVSGCPVSVDIPGFIALIKEGKVEDAFAKIRETNSLPAICGRVCPQENQCEARCVLGKSGQPVAIGALERFVADYCREKDGTFARKAVKPIALTNRAKVAVVGSGPAGLTAAADLALLGYEVTVFESLHEFGGVLRYGIPEFRLPKAILDYEIDYIRSLGVRFVPDAIVGKTITTDDLTALGYRAVFIGTGAGLPYFLGIPGENLIGVYSANEYLTRSNLMKAYLFPEHETPIRRGKRVAVIGGGNVAIDSARTALRLGADEVFVVYRRSRAEMPARAEEIINAEEEGVTLVLLTSPVEIVGDDSGQVVALECIRNQLGEPDASGRRRPVPIEGSEYAIDVDTVIVAIGQGPNPLFTEATPSLLTDERGYIVVDADTGATNLNGFYAGGDIVTGAATVIAAMGAGRKAAKAIHRYLRSDSQ